MHFYSQAGGLWKACLVIIIIIIITTTMFMVLSSWHSHCESSPSSFDECRLSAGWPPTLRPNQPIWAASPPKIGCYHLQTPSPFIIITQLVSCYWELPVCFSSLGFHIYSTAVLKCSEKLGIGSQKWCTFHTRNPGTGEPCSAGLGLDLFWCFCVVLTSSVMATHTWNSLPSDVRSCRTVDTFKRHLKTHLFRQS